jgi:hypothetical protein
MDFGRIRLYVRGALQIDVESGEKMSIGRIAVIFNSPKNCVTV